MKEPYANTPMPDSMPRREAVVFGWDNRHCCYVMFATHLVSADGEDCVSGPANTNDTSVEWVNYA